MAKKTIEVIRVALPLNRRFTNDKLNQFGQVIEMASDVEKNKVKLGNLGLMIKSDYERGLYGAYNLKESDIKSESTVAESTAMKVNEVLQSTLAEREAEIEKLKAQLAAGKGRAKKEVTNEAE